MKSLSRILLISAACIGLLLGCAPSDLEIVSETDEKQYQLAQDYKNQGRMEEALSENPNEPSQSE